MSDFQIGDIVEFTFSPGVTFVVITVSPRGTLFLKWQQDTTSVPPEKQSTLRKVQPQDSTPQTDTESITTCQP